MSQVGRTALIAACEHGHLDVVTTLLAAGAYKEAKDKVGVYLRPYGRRGGSVQLRLRGDNITVVFFVVYASQWGETPLRAASARCHSKVVMALLAAGGRQ